LVKTVIKSLKIGAKSKHSVRCKRTHGDVLKKCKKKFKFFNFFLKKPLTIFSYGDIIFMLTQKGLVAPLA